MSGALRAEPARRAGSASSARWRRPGASTARSSSCRPTTRSPSGARPSTGLTAPERAVLLAYSQDRALRRAARLATLPDDAYVATRARALLPARRCASATARDHAAPPAAPRDHRHARHQQHDQPRRQHLRAPHAGGDRRAAAPTWCAPTSSCATSSAWCALARDRRARQQGPRRVAERDADRRRPPHRARHALVPAPPAAPRRPRRARSSTSRPGAERLAALFPQLLPAIDAAAFTPAAAGWRRTACRAELAARVAGLDAHVQRARHRRGRRPPQARHRRQSRGCTSGSPASSTSPGCARASAPCRPTTTGRRSPRPPCATTSPACCARSPPTPCAPPGDRRLRAWKARNAVLYERFRQVLADLRARRVARPRDALGRDAGAAQPQLALKPPFSATCQRAQQPRAIAAPSAAVHAGERLRLSLATRCTCCSRARSALTAKGKPIGSGQGRARSSARWRRSAESPRSATAVAHTDVPRASRSTTSSSTPRCRRSPSSR